MTEQLVKIFFLPLPGQHRRAVPEHGLQHAEGRQGPPHARPDRHLRGPEGRAGRRAGLPQGILPDQGMIELTNNHVVFCYTG